MLSRLLWLAPRLPMAGCANPWLRVALVVRSVLLFGVASFWLFMLTIPIAVRFSGVDLQAMIESPIGRIVCVVIYGVVITEFGVSPGCIQELSYDLYMRWCELFGAGEEVSYLIYAGGMISAYAELQREVRPHKQ